jgi:hypothetical protein
MLKAAEWNVLSKLLFASDYPITTAQETLDALHTVNQITDGTRLPRVPEDQIEDIIYRDSLKLLELT